MRLRDGRFRKYRKSINAPGEAHVLTFSCYHGLRLLERDRTRQWFLAALETARLRWNFAIWAWVLMPEHAHVLIFPREPAYDIALILKAVKQPVAQRAMAWLRKHAPAFLDHLAAPDRHGEVEYRFWQAGGGYDRNVVRVSTAWAQIDYLHRNPVRRKLVTNPLDWPYSSARFYAGLDGCPLIPDPPEM